MMKLTREDLAMMLDEMNNCGADYIDVDVYVRYDYDLSKVDFDACKKDGKFIKTLLTLE